MHSNNTVNQLSSVVAAVAISFIAMGAFLILPLYLGAVAHSFQLSEQQVGFSAAAIIMGSAISSLLAISWVRRVNWQQAGAVALGLVLIGHAGSLFVESTAQFILLQVIAGFGAGAAYSVVLTSLSDNQHADRCFGFTIAAQVSFQVVGMLLLPGYVEQYGLQAILTVLASLEVIGIVLLRWLPASGTSTEATQSVSAITRPGVLMALGGCFMFFCNVGALWVYIERMGAAAAFDSDYIGLSLAVGVAFGIPGALLASWCEERFGRSAPLALGAVLTVAALLLLLNGMSATQYMVALALYNFAWNFSLTFQYAAVNAADDSGRGVAAAPAFHGIGGAIGPAIAALFLSESNFLSVNIVAIVSVFLSLLLFVLSSRFSSGAREAATA